MQFQTYCLIFLRKQLICYTIISDVFVWFRSKDTFSFRLPHCFRDTHWEYNNLMKFQLLGNALYNRLPLTRRENESEGSLASINSFRSSFNSKVKPWLLDHLYTLHLQHIEGNATWYFFNEGWGFMHLNAHSWTATTAHWTWSNPAVTWSQHQNLSLKFCPKLI